MTRKRTIKIEWHESDTISELSLAFEQEEPRKHLRGLIIVARPTGIEPVARFLELLERHERGQLNRFLKSLAQKDLLILDEVGYVPASKKASELLFSLVSNSYENQSIIITSNLELGRWNEVFGDDRLTALLNCQRQHATKGQGRGPENKTKKRGRVDTNAVPTRPLP